MQTVFRTTSAPQNLQTPSDPIIPATQLIVAPQKTESNESQRPLSSIIFEQKIYENSTKTTQIFKGTYQNREVAIKFDTNLSGKAELTAMKWLQEKSSGTQVFGPTEFDELAGNLPARLSIFPGVPLLAGGETVAQGIGPATYIVSPYYGEGDLFGLIEKNGSLPLNFIRPVAYQLLYYLATLEAHNKIHCDIKPENIFLESGTIRIGDLAMMQNLEAQTQIGPGTLFGSRPYMAPELFLNTQDFGKIDVWSAGITLLGCATGSLLFNSDDTTDSIPFQKERLFQTIQTLGPIPGILLEKTNPNQIGIEGITEQPSILGNLLGKNGSYAGPTPAQLPESPISIDELIEEVYGPHTEETPWSEELCDFSSLMHEMIAWDPKRIRAREALHHPFFTPLFTKN